MLSILSYHLHLAKQTTQGKYNYQIVKIIPFLLVAHCILQIWLYYLDDVAYPDIWKPENTIVIFSRILIKKKVNHKQTKKTPHPMSFF